MTTLTLTVDPMRYIERLPEYGGKRDELYAFIGVVEDIIPVLAKYNTEGQNILLNRIKAKLVQGARQAIEIDNSASSWKEIKEVLINNFGDKKSADQIFDEMRALNFVDNSVNFYKNIKLVLRRLNNKCRDETNGKTICAANTQSALNIFKQKLPEPMRSIIFSRNPQSLEDAMDILYQGNYAFHNPINRSFPENSNFKNQNFKNSTYPKKNYNNDFRHSNGQANGATNYRGENPNNFNNTNRDANPNNFNHNYRGRYQNNSNNNYRTGNSYNNYRVQNTNNSNNNYRNSNNYQNSTNNRPEPMDVDPSVHQFENFPALASDTSYPI